MKTIWIVSGGAEAVPGIHRAKEMGFNVIVSDGNPQAPGFREAHHSIVMDTYNVAGTVDAAREYHKSVNSIDGVISIAADVPLTVAKVADELGLPGIPLESAQLSSDKFAMKNRFSERNIPIPWYCQIESENHLRKIVTDSDFSLVIKPVDSRGARGVMRLSPEVDLKWAFHHSLQFSPSGRVMVEEFLNGPQVSTESILLDGIGYNIGFSDRNYEFLDLFAPNIIENGGEQPSFLELDDQLIISQLAEEAGRALGIKNGIVKGDMVLTTEGPKVIEIAPRLSGGSFCTDQIPLSTGVDLIGNAIKLALGLKVDPEELIPRYRNGVAIRYFFPNQGRVNSIEGIEQFENVPWVYQLKFFVKPGNIIEPISDHTKRGGFVITTGDTSKQAVERAEQVIKAVKIISTPV